MKKIYFKKIKRGIIYALILYLIYGVGADILVTLSNFFERPLLRIAITLGIPTVILFIMATHYRTNDTEKFKEYNKSVTYEKLPITKDALYIVRSKDFLGEILAAVTLIGIYLFPTLLIGATKTGGAAAIPKALLSIVISLAVAITCYAVADVISWLIVHRNYLADRDLVVLDDERIDK